MKWWQVRHYLPFEDGHHEEPGEQHPIEVVADISVPPGVIEDISANQDSLKEADFVPINVKEVKWKSGTLTEPYIPFEDPPSKTGATPFEPSCNHYFSRYIPESIFSTMVQYTNMYAMQSDSAMKPCTLDEVTTLVGLHILTGCLQYPRLRLYWDTVFSCTVFKDNMSVNRFFQLRQNLHLVDTLARPEGCHDRLWKKEKGQAGWSGPGRTRARATEEMLLRSPSKEGTRF